MHTRSQCALISGLGFPPPTSLLHIGRQPSTNKKTTMSDRHHFKQMHFPSYYLCCQKRLKGQQTVTTYLTQVPAHLHTTQKPFAHRESAFSENKLVFENSPFNYSGPTCNLWCDTSEHDSPRKVRVWFLNWWVCCGVALLSTVLLGSGVMV